MRGYYCAKNDRYHVIYKHKLWAKFFFNVDEWNCCGGEWMKHKILSESMIYELYQINNTLRIPNVDLGECSSVLIEDYVVWRNRMHEMLKLITCLDRMSSDLLLLILVYIS